MRAKNLHEGHRQRMKAKLENGENLYDHEILEILLYNAFPRVNTNPIAHDLLERFGSLAEVFKAPAEELKCVKGVGESCAQFLTTVGMCIERAGKVEGVAVLKNTEDFKKFTEMRLKNKREEFLELYLLDKSGKVKRILSYTSADKNAVTANAEELSRNIAIVKPYALLAAHNHLNGRVTPSEKDGEFTTKLQFICNMINVNFLDHLIYGGGNLFYSYRQEGEMEKIKKECSLNNLDKWIKK